MFSQIAKVCCELFLQQVEMSVTQLYDCATLHEKNKRCSRLFPDSKVFFFNSGKVQITKYLVWDSLFLEKK